MEEEQLSGSSSESRPRIEPVAPDYPGKKTLIRGQWYRQEDQEAAMRQVKEEEQAEWAREERQEWEDSPEGEMCMELYEKFHAYRKFIRGVGLPEYMKFKEHRLFVRALKWGERLAKDRAETDRQNLERAQLAERCEHIHASGARCGSPKMNGGLLCYKHQRMEEARALKLDLGTMEDPEGIHLGIMKLQRAVIDGTLDGKQVTQLTNLMQIAAWNARTKPSRKEAK